ncbi:MULTISPECIES: hypothetical protein [Mesorhizobium]|uniref:PAAR motif-containing protein n=1 Tax=Mesorhizobium qingshengii TaxID=1165689 RepID=A0A1G5ZY72_9HYPH|nr:MULTISPECIES: hypothetical protein [Mesorhizobium]MCH4561117.1 hypothetical protein [Mesorhizobium jarvisii]QGU21143.1 hypothetical protein MCHK_12920 [Mesorhizobium huakuii 7653R]SDA99540.1 hypothetical protein SAMN02927914_06616 [Mesorhizobium qingshengii]
MPGTVLHTGTIATCPHGGTLNIVAASPRVSVSGMRVAVLTDQGLVAGCVFTLPSGKPQPCVTTRWIAGAKRVLANGQPILINPLAALCLSAEQVPGGPPIIATSQTRVIAT